MCPSRWFTPTSGAPVASATAFAGSDPDEKRPGQTRPDRDGDPVQVREPAPRLLERLVHQRIERLDVRAAGELRHDSAEAGVQLDLAPDQVGQDAAVLDHRDGRLVAGRLDPQDLHAGPSGRMPSGASCISSRSRARYSWVRTRSSHMMRASSLISW